MVKKIISVEVEIDSENVDKKLDELKAYIETICSKQKWHWYGIFEDFVLLYDPNKVFHQQFGRINTISLNPILIKSIQISYITKPCCFLCSNVCKINNEQEVASNIPEEVNCKIKKGKRKYRVERKCEEFNPLEERFSFLKERRNVRIAGESFGILD